MSTLRQIILFATMVALSLSVTAQPKPAGHPLEHPFATEFDRTQIFLPQIDGKTFYKADLHLHTIFSDGDVTPDMRVVEAWYDGLDIIAITDHMEYRRIEPAGEWNYAVDFTEDVDLEYSEGAIRIPVRKIDWTLQENRYTPKVPAPEDVKPLSDEVVYLDLVPYGGTELRLTVSPIVK